MTTGLFRTLLLCGALAACTTTTNSTAIPAADPKPVTTVQLARSPLLGDVVVDGEGYTLYRYDHDKASPSTSTCTDECAKTWLPVLASDEITYRNLDPSFLNTRTRPDGSRQLTIGGWPAYRFTDDRVPGQFSGQSLDDTWFALAPNGTKAGGGKRAA